MSFRLCAIVLACVAATGCASITNDSTAPVRFETVNAAGVEIKDVDCKLENDYGQQTLKPLPPSMCAARPRTCKSPA